MSFKSCLYGLLKSRSVLPRVMYHIGLEFRRNGLLKSKSSNFLDFVKTLTNKCQLLQISDTGNVHCNRENLRPECNLLGPVNNVIADPKLVKVAVVGTPNAGKSTFINRLVNRRVCSMSSKVHTTRSKAKAILNERNTQVIFLDTPGLVNANDSKRHNLEKSFLVDAELCIKESDLVAVIHDVSNVWTRDCLDLKMLRLLHLYQEKSSILIMNKVDALKSKRKLLDLTHSLTCGSLKEVLVQTSNSYIDKAQLYEIYLPDKNNNSISEKTVNQAIGNEIGWPYFEAVFMISALTGSGIDDLKEFILQKGIRRPWIFPPSVFTDQKMEELIVLAVREKLLEFLPKEIPYNLRTKIEHFHISPAGDVIAVVLINCNHERHEKMLIGSAGNKIKEIAKAAEQALESTFMENVNLKIVVQSKK